MVELNILPRSSELLPDAFPAPVPVPAKGENVVHLDDYRLHLHRPETLRQIAAAALTFATEGKFLPEPLIIDEHTNGSTTVIFSESERGFYGDVHATSRINGWSGGPETERIIVVHYDTESDAATASYLHPRNRRYLQSDIRTQQRMEDYEDKLQALRDEVRKPLKA